MPATQKTPDARAIIGRVFVAYCQQPDIEYLPDDFTSLLRKELPPAQTIRVHVDSETRLFWNKETGAASFWQVEVGAKHFLLPCPTDAKEFALRNSIEIRFAISWQGGPNNLGPARLVKCVPGLLVKEANDSEQAWQLSERGELWFGPRSAIGETDLDKIISRETENPGGQGPTEPPDPKDPWHTTTSKDIISPPSPVVPITPGVAGLPGKPPSQKSYPVYVTVAILLVILVTAASVIAVMWAGPDKSKKPNPPPRIVIAQKPVPTNPPPPPPPPTNLLIQVAPESRPPAGLVVSAATNAPPKIDAQAEQLQKWAADFDECLRGSNMTELGEILAAAPAASRGTETFATRNAEFEELQRLALDCHQTISATGSVDRCLRARAKLTTSIEQRPVLATMLQPWASALDYIKENFTMARNEVDTGNYSDAAAKCDDILKIAPGLLDVQALRKECWLETMKANLDRAARQNDWVAIETNLAQIKGSGDYAVIADVVEAQSQRKNYYLKMRSELAGGNMTSASELNPLTADLGRLAEDEPSVVKIYTAERFYRNADFYGKYPIPEERKQLQERREAIIGVLIEKALAASDADGLRRLGESVIQPEDVELRERVARVLNDLIAHLQQKRDAQLKAIADEFAGVDQIPKLSQKNKEKLYARLAAIQSQRAPLFEGSNDLKTALDAWRDKIDQKPVYVPPDTSSGIVR